MKRAFEIILSFGIFVFLLPLLLVVGIAVAIDLGYPVLFKQRRPGLHGRPFVLYKFRTMRNAVDERGIPLSDAERLTTFGQFLRASSLDELPEIVNVLKGDMSFVGPRPLLLEYMPLYTARQAQRHNVRPGITGWAQVNGRNAISWDEKFELDVWYVANRSVWLDLKILCLTVKQVLRREGISQANHATAEPFRGSP